MTATMRYAHPDAIVGTQWLADNLRDPALRVFDCTTHLRYETGTGRPYRVESARADPVLVKALARAFRYQRMLDEGRYTSISETAAAERIERGYLGSLLRLTLLAPDLVEAMLDGRQPADMTLPRLLAPFPAGWSEQRAIMPGASARPGPAASG